MVLFNFINIVRTAQRQRSCPQKPRLETDEMSNQFPLSY